MNALAFNLSKTNILDVISAAAAADDLVIGKYEDSAVVFKFNHDSKYIYATDVDALEYDVFGACHIPSEFTAILREHGFCLAFMKEYFEPLFDSEYEFSNSNESGSAPIRDVLI